MGLSRIKKEVTFKMFCEIANSLLIDEFSYSEISEELVSINEEDVRIIDVYLKVARKQIDEGYTIPIYEEYPYKNQNYYIDYAWEYYRLYKF